MICRKCGTDINTSVRLPDGTVQCPGCGVIYRSKSSGNSKNTDRTGKNDNPASSQSDSYTKRKQQAGQSFNRAKKASGKAGQWIVEQARDIDYDGIREKASKGVNVARRSAGGAGKGLLALKIGNFPAWMFLIAAVALIALVSGVASGNKYADQYKLLSRFETAYNKQDVNGILDCSDPTIAESILAVAGMLGVDTNEVRQFIPFAGLLVQNTGISLAEDWGKIKLKPKSCEVDGNYALVQYNITWTSRNGDSVSFDSNARIKKVNGEWYFASI